jgi:hypothetical protein
MATASRTAAKAPRLSATIKNHNAQNAPKTPSRAQVSLELNRLVSTTPNRSLERAGALIRAPHLNWGLTDYDFSSLTLLAKTLIRKPLALS